MDPLHIELRQTAVISDSLRGPGVEPRCMPARPDYEQEIGTLHDFFADRYCAGCDRSAFERVRPDSEYCESVPYRPHDAVRSNWKTVAILTMSRVWSSADCPMGPPLFGCEVSELRCVGSSVSLLSLSAGTLKEVFEVSTGWLPFFSEVVSTSRLSVVLVVVFGRFLA